MIDTKKGKFIISDTFDVNGNIYTLAISISDTDHYYTFKFKTPKEEMVKYINNLKD